MARNPQTFIDLALRHATYLERLKGTQAKNYTAVLNKLEKAVLDTVRALDVDDLSQFTRGKINKILADLRKTELKYLKKNNEEFVKSLKSLTGQEINFQVNFLKLAVKTAEVRAAVKSAKIATTFAEAFNNPLGSGELLTSFLDGYTQRTIIGIENTVRRAWSEGRTIPELTRAIRGTKAANYNDGLIAASRRQGEAIARTSTAHVANQTYQEVWQNNEELTKGYKWVSTLDDRTTAGCRALDGQIFEFGKGPIPPLHINCRSVTIPEMADEFKGLLKGATRSGEFGSVPADMTYYEWLKTQDREYVIETLGENRGKLFLDGDLTAEQYRKLSVDEKWQPLTLEEMQEKNAAAFKRAGLDE